ncbi:MAG: RagB/SusD family nutrient uptake outer membrane protein [Prevotella sp.]
MMKKLADTIFYLWPLAAVLTLYGCIDEETPTNSATKEQIEGSGSSFAMLVNGLNSKMISYENYYTSSDSYSYVGTWYATQDWGYPCYMYVRETLLDGFPTTDTSWNYQLYFEQATDLTASTAPVYYYYYSLINNANRILASQDEQTASTSIRQSLGKTRVYRALSYMDLSMMFEFYRTGNAELDGKAEAVWGLTVPIVTEKTTNSEAKNNPRAPFYKMYRFIYSDLSKAEEDLKDFVRGQKNEVNIDVVNGMLARFWLNMATRFRKNPEDLALQLQHEGDDDGFHALGIATASDCYRLASAYAQKVISAGYSPVTESQWHDSATGFNTANQAWVWDMRFSAIEQVPDYWCTIMGLTASEPTWGMPAYGDAYRCISKRYYDKIQEGDWRKTTWIDPKDAEAVNVPEKYNSLLADDNVASRAQNTNFSRLPAYANLKYRPGSGDIIDDQKGLLCDIPLMRVEEMYFIQIECDYYLNGLEAGIAGLESFMNAYRWGDTGRYVCDASYSTAFVYELMVQKYIEFWGEGILYNDFKRLRLGITRTYEGSNYLEAYQINSKDGYCAPWLNFFIPEAERSFNQGIEMNPDPTPYCN